MLIFIVFMFACIDQLIKLILLVTLDFDQDEELERFWSSLS